jgi:protein XRP2
MPKKEVFHEADVEQVPDRVVRDRSWYIVSDKTEERISRGPGDLDGNQFNLSKIIRCQVIVQDLVDSMFVDDCENSEFVLAAIRGSIFVRNCKDCKFVMVCGQFRCVNCIKCDFFMHAKTGPVVESSQGLRIGCASIAYPTLLNDMKRANIGRYVNLWSDVHDFTPGHGNFSVCDGEKLGFDFYPFSPENSVIPFLLSKEHGGQYVAKFHLRDEDALVQRSNECSAFCQFKKSDDEQFLLCYMRGSSKNVVLEVLSGLSPVEVKSES